MALEILNALPNWSRGTVKDGYVKRAKSGKPTWSGKGPPPAVGTRVQVRVNQIGDSLVKGYFVEHQYLGLYVKPLDPPEWYVKQNGRGTCCHVFGAEIVG